MEIRVKREINYLEWAKQLEENVSTVRSQIKNLRACMGVYAATAQLGREFLSPAQDAPVPNEFDKVMDRWATLDTLLEMQAETRKNPAGFKYYSSGSNFFYEPISKLHSSVEEIVTPLIDEY